MKKKNIGIIFPKNSEAFFARDSSAPFGGATVQMFTLADELIKNNTAEVVSFVPLYKNMDKETCDRLNVCVTYKPGDSALVKIYIFFRKVIFNTRASIIIQHGLTYPSCFLALILFILRKKFVFMFASDVEAEGRFQSDKKKCYLFPILLRFSVLVSQNKWQQTNLKEKYKKNSFIYYNGFNFSVKKKITKKKYILWVSRADSMKQPEIFISLARDIPGAEFIMICPNIGYDKAYMELHKSISDLKNFKIIEFVPFTEIQKYFDEAYLFVNTSKYEGFPQTFIQAAIAETPVISLNVDPDGFISENDCGVVCSNNYNLMKESIQNLLRNKVKYKELRENIKQYGFKNHNITKNVESLNSYINSRTVKTKEL